MSKLIEHLEKVGIVASTPFGFGANRVPEKASSMLLVALSGPAAAKSSPKVRADSFVTLVPKVAKRALDTAKGAAGEGPWGLWPGALDVKSLKALEEAGGDFFVFSLANTPAEVLVAEELGRIVSIPVDLPDELGRALEELPADAVLVTGMEEASPLSVRDLLQIRATRDLTSKPFLLLRARALSPGELSVLQDAGVQAVVLDLRAMDAADATRMSEAIEGLAPRKVKRKPAAAVLPSHSPGRAAAVRREEEEEAEEDDDY